MYSIQTKPAQVPSCLNAKSSEERVVYKKAELNRNVDSENNHGGSSRTYVLHRTGCSQEDDQLLRQGCERSGSPGRPDRSNTLGTGRLDEDSSATLDRGDGSNDFYRLDLRSSASACSAGEGSASADAARHRCGQEEERSHRCRQDRRLPALRLPAGMPHASTAIRDRRRTLRYRHLLVRQMVQMKNRITGQPERATTSDACT